MNKLAKKSLFTTSPTFWLKVAQFLIFAALILSQMVLFVGRDLNVYYGSSISKGFGLILTSIAWLLWNQLAKRKTWSKYFVQETVTIVTLILGVCLVPHVLSFVIMGIIIILEIVYIFALQPQSLEVSNKKSN